MSWIRAALSAAVVAACVLAPWIPVPRPSGSGAAWAGGACQVEVSPVAFGAYDPLAAAPRDSQGMLTVDCPAGVAFTVTLDTGLGRRFFPRAMRRADGRGKLPYNLYRDAARTFIWGDGSGHSAPLEGDGAGAPQAFPVFGRIPPHQDAPPGAYRDAVTVTVTYLP